MGLLLAPSAGLWPRLFLFWERKRAFTLFVLILGYFWCSVTLKKAQKKQEIIKKYKKKMKKMKKIKQKN